MLSETAASAPHQPGVYIFKDDKGNPIYIGKAKDLHNRLLSYFSGKLSDRITQMLRSASLLEFVVTDSEAEAFLLESQLIKQYYPKYNIQLKDNQRYTYILITDEEFPRMLVVRRNRLGKFVQKGSLFGPFLPGSAYILAASTLRKIFRIRTCKLGQKRPCLQYHLGFCLGPCAGLISPKEYQKQVEKLKAVLSGGKELEKVIDEMEKEMREATKHRLYEKAIQLRDSIKLLSSLRERQKMESVKCANEDYIAFIEHNGTVYLQMFRKKDGVIRDRKKFELQPLNPQDVLSEFLPRFYEADSIPPTIVVDSIPPSKEALEKFLSMKRGSKVTILSPQKGDKKELLLLLRKNILMEIAGNADPALLELQEKLRLPSIPKIIECFDVSNLFGSHIVGAMVQFTNGSPNKSAYRRFKISSVEGQNDFAAIREIVFRRYRRLKEENSQFPDLIVIDGGIAQLNAARAALNSLNIHLPCIAIAKEREEIFHPDSPTPIVLPKSSQALNILRHARDEAHRFVISYHRFLRKKGALSS
ncbi:MAG: excinuclease ABC subunit UvrC [Candidatus Micrarchaeota archaeon]|nr:excinuclease ABC subunit UvrC [Candidatus Micrarchaeota archaeon]